MITATGTAKIFWPWTARQYFLQGRQLEKPNFSLVDFIRHPTRALPRVGAGFQFPYLRRYAPLIKTKSNRRKKTALAGYEMALNFNGVPIELIPRAGFRNKEQKQISVAVGQCCEQQKTPVAKLSGKEGLAGN